MKESYTGAVVWLLVIIAIVLVLFSLNNQSQRENLRGDVDLGASLGYCILNSSGIYDCCRKHKSEKECQHQQTLNILGCTKGYMPNIPLTC